VNLRDKFLKKGFSFTNYAKSRGLNRTMLHKVIAGVLTGRRKTQKGMVAKIIRSLQEDGVM